MAVDKLRKGNTVKISTTVNENGVVYPALATADLVRCALVNYSTKVIAVEVDSDDSNIVLDDGSTGVVGWTLTATQTAALSEGFHILSIQVEDGDKRLEWVEDRAVDVQPQYLT